jgi:hypothetical protein
VTGVRRGVRSGGGLFLDSVALRLDHHNITSFVFDGRSDLPLRRFAACKDPCVLLYKLTSGNSAWSRARCARADLTVATGTGVQVTAAQAIVFLEPVYPLDKRDQAIARVVRQGQTARVDVHTLVTIGTLEHKSHTLGARRATKLQQLRMLSPVRDDQTLPDNTYHFGCV